MSTDGSQALRSDGDGSPEPLPRYRTRSRRSPRPPRPGSPMPALEIGSTQQPKNQQSKNRQPKSLGAVNQVLTLPGNGLRLPHKFSFDMWLAVGQQLAATASLSAWCLGDWLVYGEDIFPGRYREAIERTSLDYKTLRNYAWVTRRFPMSRRRDTLSFGHHAEVAALPRPEQDYWLRKADELGWSRNQLRREVRASLTERNSDTEDTVSASAEGATDQGFDSAETISVPLSQDQLEACIQAANRGGYSIHEWAARTLYEAARLECEDTMLARSL
jgi:hypothetical protein